MYPLDVKGKQVPPKRHGLLPHTDNSHMSPKYPFLQWQVHDSFTAAQVAPFLQGFERQTNDEHSVTSKPSSASLKMLIGLPNI